MTWRRRWLLFTLSVYFAFLTIATLSAVIGIILLFARAWGPGLIAIIVAIGFGLMARSTNRSARRMTER